MSWFKRSKENIASETQKKEIPDGLWTKCEQCGEIIHRMELEKNPPWSGEFAGKVPTL